MTMSVSAQTKRLGQRFDTPPPSAARDLVKRGVELAGQDRVDEAIAAVKKAIAISPNYLEAHQAYLRLKIDFQGQVDEVISEYESLMAREPDNPIYPAAMSQGLSGRVATYRWVKKVAELAPEWSWGHYARSYVIVGRDFDLINDKYEGKGEQILAEVLKAIEKDGTVKIFYSRAIQLQENFGRIDEAISTAEKMAAQPGLHADGLAELWRLRVAKAKGSESARESVKAELARLSAGSQDIVLLAAIRNAYANLLKDSVSAVAIERQVRQLDPTWYPERGRADFSIVLNSTGIPYPVLAANRQLAIYEKLRQIVLQREADSRKEIRQTRKFAFPPPKPGSEETHLRSSLRRGAPSGRRTLDDQVWRATTPPRCHGNRAVRENRFGLGPEGNKFAEGTRLRTPSGRRGCRISSDGASAGNSCPRFRGQVFVEGPTGELQASAGAGV